MANKGDTFTVTLNEAQLGWGDFRFTNSRVIRYGEGYLKIPSPYASTLHLYNNNRTHGADVAGENIFNCTSTDGFFKGTLRSQGCISGGEIYAKQFAGDKNLTALGSWYAQINAQIGDRIRVTFTSPTDIILEKL